MVAAGGNGSLFLWDRRTSGQLACLDDTHMDIITVTRFHPANSNILFSGSDDGLIAAFDFTNGINEDDAWVVRAPAPSCPLLPPARYLT